MPIKNHITPIGFDLTRYVSELASMPTEAQKVLSEAVICASRQPKDYPVDTYEDFVSDNADIIATYIEKYDEKAKFIPNNYLDTLQMELGKKIIELIERNK